MSSTPREPAGEAPAIACRGVEKHYEGGLVKALDGVDISIGQGEFVAIMGPSGSGKSTLLHLVGALDHPSAGAVSILGEDLAAVANLDRLRAETIGFIFQLHNLIPNLSLRENVALPMHAKAGVARRTMMDRAGDLLERVGLGHRVDFLPVKVSGGERQRAAIARGLINDPRIILADEPTGSVDSATGEIIMSLLLEIQRERGTTLVLITHNEELAARADRTIRLRDGVVEKVDTRVAPAESPEPEKASA